MLTKRGVRIDLSLHDVKLMVNVWQSFLGLDKNETVHPIGDVFSDHWRRAVIDVKTRHKRFPGHGLLLTGIDLKRSRAATGTGRGMEIHRMDHGAVGRILEVNVDRVTHPHANERTRDFPVDGPVANGGGLRQTTFDFNT